MSLTLSANCSELSRFVVGLDLLDDTLGVLGANGAPAGLVAPAARALVLVHELLHAVMAILLVVFAFSARVHALVLRLWLGRRNCNFFNKVELIKK